MMIRVADYIASFFAEKGCRHVFMVTGGGAMHLNDAFGRESRLKIVCNHHEQACAVGAEGYTRVGGIPAVVCVTTGPGGTNALTGVLGQWLDSIPAIYISGQVRFDTTVASTGLSLRQLGDQEANIVEIVKPITKYAVMVTDPKTIRHHLEKAWKLALSGRPGPVWLDVPLNVQAAQIDPLELSAVDAEVDAAGGGELGGLLDEVVRRMKEAKRPVLLVGAGIRLAGATGEMKNLMDQLGFPVQAAWDAIDLVATDHPLYAGRPSTVGQRAANFIFQNSDFLLSIGCRLNVRQIGYTFASVARAAYKVVVDIDPEELKKPTIKIDLPVCADAKVFMRELAAKVDAAGITVAPEWLSWCRERLKRYPPVSAGQYRDHPLNPYAFCERLSQKLTAADVIVSSNGSSCVIPIQTMEIKEGQRHIVNSGCASMGYGLPAAIGACFGRPGNRVICLEGDGSIQMNIQELQTVVHHQLPLKIFVFNNNGYLSIHSTQKNFFAGNFVGESPQSGVSFPDMVRLAQAYGITAFRMERLTDLDQLGDILDRPGPCLCDVVVDVEQAFEPRIASRRLADGKMVSSPLEDMYPFLDREEFLSNMIIAPWEA